MVRQKSPVIEAFVLMLWASAGAQDVPREVLGFDRALLRSMVYAADSLFRGGRYADAESAYEAVLAADSNSAGGLVGWAEAVMANPKSRRTRSDAYRAYRRAIRLSPPSAALHLRFGTALLPWRSPADGGESDSELLVQAIQNLERAVALAPGKSEVHLGLYLAYLARGTPDRARAQLHDLADKQHFAAPALDFAYDLLISVDSGGYLLTQGDVDTYAALVLQATTGLRTDVTIVNIPLLNTAWYVRHLKRTRRLPVSFSDELINTMQPKYDKRLEVTLSPGRRVLHDVIANRSRVKGGFYFALTVNKETMEPYRRELSLEGFVYRVTSQGRDIPLNRERCRANLGTRYRLPDFTPPDTGQETDWYRSRDCGDLAVNCAAAMLALADDYHAAREIARAAVLCRQAGSILIAVGRWHTFEKVLDYWLKMAPNDIEALRLKRDYYGGRPK